VALILAAALASLLWQAAWPSITVVAIVLLVAGLLLSAPQEPEQVLLAATLGGYIAFSLQLQSFPAWALAFAWVMAGVQIHLQRRWVPDEHLRTDTQGRAAGLLLVTVLLPTCFAWVAERSGTRLVLAALLLALTPALVGHPVAPTLALPVAVATVLGLTWVQRQSLRLARWLAARF